MATYIADPQAKLDYTEDWSKWLATGETITASTWTVDSGITVTTPAPSFTATTSTVWLTGGSIGMTYAATNHITTSAGRQDERTITIAVVDR